MNDLVNPYYKPEYGYCVVEFLKNWKTNQSFTHTEYFNSDNLIEARDKAVLYYLGRSSGFSENRIEEFFGAKFTDPSEIGKAKIEASFSISLNFVIDLGSEFEQMLPLLGESDQEIEEARLTEVLAYKELGLPAPPLLVEK